MAIWHSFLLVGHYRIFRAMNTLTNYHRLEVKPKMELSVSYEIASLKEFVDDAIVFLYSPAL